MMWALALGTLATVAWYANVRLRPWKTCRACGGTGRLKGVIYGTHADCRRCSATGRVRRIGAPGE